MIKQKLYIHKVPLDFQSKTRLREYVKGLFPYLETTSAVKKAIKKNQIKIDNKLGHTGDWVYAGNEIRFEFSYSFSEIKQVEVEIFYEDDHLLVVRKPPGLSSSGNTRSLQQRLQRIEIKDSDGALPYPYLIHRLDKATEGLIIAAKTLEARRSFGIMLKDHSIKKHYVLIAEGHLPNTIQWINAKLDGKNAQTEILKSLSLNTLDPTTKVYVRIHTGRTHQIRRHFADLGYPIVGDNLYNRNGLTFGTGLLLCAYSLEFEHPITTDTIKVDYPVPKKIEKYPVLED